MDFLNSKSESTGLVAGLGSGKSFIGTLKLLLFKTRYRNIDCAYYLPSYPLVQDIAFDKFPKMCDLFNLKYKLNKSTKEIQIAGCGRVVFRTMSEPESIVGYEVGYSVIDECDNLPLDKMTIAYENICDRNRVKLKIDSLKIGETANVLFELERSDKIEIDDILFDGVKFLNLKMIKNYRYYSLTFEALENFENLEGVSFDVELSDIVNVEFIETNKVDVVGTPEGYKWFYNNFKKKPLVGSKLITATTYSNLHNLPPDYIDKLKGRYPPNRLNAYLQGKFTNLLSGTVYSYFDRNKHNTDIVENDNEYLFIGQDFNLGGCCSVVFIVRGDICIAVDEFSSHDTRKVVLNAKDKYEDKQHTIEFYPDASGAHGETNASQSDIDILVAGGYNVNAPPSNGRIVNRVNDVNNLLSKHRFLINVRRCPHLTSSLEQQGYDKNGKPEKFAGSATIDDWNDAMGYFITRYFGTRSNTIKIVTNKHT